MDIITNANGEIILEPANNSIITMPPTKQYIKLGVKSAMSDFFDIGLNNRITLLQKLKSGEFHDGDRCTGSGSFADNDDAALIPLNLTSTLTELDQAYWEPSLTNKNTWCTGYYTRALKSGNTYGYEVYLRTNSSISGGEDDTVNLGSVLLNSTGDISAIMPVNLLFLVVKIKTINGTLQAVPTTEDLNTVFNFIFEYSFDKMVLKAVTDIVYA